MSQKIGPRISSDLNSVNRLGKLRRDRVGLKLALGENKVAVFFDESVVLGGDFGDARRHEGFFVNGRDLVPGVLGLLHEQSLNPVVALEQGDTRGKGREVGGHPPLLAY